jgi:putative PIN family toxin of toxin-antitoxin system
VIGVLDANVLASGAVARPQSPLAALLDAVVLDRFDLVISQPILDELARTLNNPYFARRLARADRRDLLALVRSHARVVGLTVPVRGVATHPEDDLVLATAVAEGADYLVTGDCQLQRLASYEGVSILAPTEFLKRLTADS